MTTIQKKSYATLTQDEKLGQIAFVQEKERVAVTAHQITLDSAKTAIWAASILGEDAQEAASNSEAGLARVQSFKDTLNTKVREDAAVILRAIAEFDPKKPQAIIVTSDLGYKLSMVVPALALPYATFAWVGDPDPIAITAAAPDGSLKTKVPAIASAGACYRTILGALLQSAVTLLVAEKRVASASAGKDDEGQLAKAQEQYETLLNKAHPDSLMAATDPVVATDVALYADCAPSDPLFSTGTANGSVVVGTPENLMAGDDAALASYEWVVGRIAVATAAATEMRASLKLTGTPSPYGETIAPIQHSWWSKVSTVKPVFVELSSAASRALTIAPRRLIGLTNEFMTEFIGATEAPIEAWEAGARYLARVIRKLPNEVGIRKLNGDCETTQTITSVAQLYCECVEEPVTAEEFAALSSVESVMSVRVDGVFAAADLPAVNSITMAPIITPALFERFGFAAAASGDTVLLTKAATSPGATIILTVGNPLLASYIVDTAKFTTLMKFWQFKKDIIGALVALADTSDRGAVLTNAGNTALIAVRSRALRSWTTIAACLQRNNLPLITPFMLTNTRIRQLIAEEEAQAV